jgi:hypothetical protein
MAFTTPSNKGNAVPYYGGGQVPNPANVITATIAPSTAATANAVGTIWVNISAGTAYLAVKNTGINGTVTWDQLGLSSGTVGSLTGDSGGAVTPTAGNITVAGGTGITTSGSGSTLTVNSVGGGLKTTVVSGTTQAAAINNRYVPNNSGLVTVTLPAVAAVGSMIVVDGLGSGGWLIAQNSGQVINSSGGSTTTGAGGSLASTNRYDSVTLVNVVANTTWKIEGMVGVITIV